MISITNLTKNYQTKKGPVTGVDNVSLTGGEGEVFGIVGYSGAGKSSLLRCMDLLDELVLEDMPDRYRNLVAVKTENKDTELAQDLVEIVESPEFETLIDSEFKGFGKPEWMATR